MNMDRKRLTKAERQQVYNMYGGRCAYCGKEIAMKDMQVDHLKPLAWGGEDTMENMMPACRLCNHYKRANSLAAFRRMIASIPDKLERDSYIYKVGVRYGNVVPDKKGIRFYFEEEADDR